MVLGSFESRYIPVSIYPPLSYIQNILMSKNYACIQNNYTMHA